MALERIGFIGLGNMGGTGGISDLTSRPIHVPESFPWFLESVVSQDVV